MKKRLQGLIVGVLIGTMLTSGVVFAKQASETINVIYDNIKILIDGKEYQPTDANGNVVEPFIYNGTTYLPVRAIATAFEKEVDWEAQTSTVTLGSKNYDWLDQMGYADYKTTGSFNKIGMINKDTKTTEDIKVNRGIYFNTSFSTDFGSIELSDGTYDSYQEVEYLLNQKYNSFTGNIACLYNNEYYDAQNTNGVIIKLYGDGNLIYTSPVISKGIKLTPFEVDVSNYKILKIRVESQQKSFTSLSYSGYYTCAGITDARLSKN